MPSVNKVWVPVAPDTRTFRAETLRELSAIERSLQLTIQLVLGGATEAVRDAHREAQAAADADGVTISIDAEADTRRATAEIDEAARTRDVTIRAHTDTSTFDKLRSSLAGGFSSLDAEGANFGKALATTLPQILLSSGAIASLGSVALSSVSGVVSLGAALLPLGALAAPLPGLLIAGSAAAATFALAMKDAGTQLAGLKPGFAALQSNVSASFWAEAKKPIVDFVHSVLPSLNDGLSAVGSTLGTFTGSAASAFQTAFGPSVIHGILDPLSESIANATGGTGAFAAALGTLGTFGAQYLPQLGTAIAGIAASFNGFIQGITSSGQLSAWVQQGVAAFQELLSIGGSALSIVQGIFSAASTSGANGLQTFGGALQTIAGIVNGPAFQSTLTTIFSGAAAGAAALEQVLGPIGDLLGNLAGPISNGLSGLSGAFGGIISGLATALSQPAVVQGFSDAITGLIGGLNGLVPAIGPIASALGPVLSLFGSLAGTVGPLLGTALATVTPLIASVAMSLGPLVAEIGPQLQSTITQLAPLFTSLAAAAGPILQAILPAGVAVFGALADVVVALQPAITSVINAVVPVIQSLATVITGVADVVSGILTGNLTETFQGFGEVTSGTFGAIAGAITGAVGIAKTQIQTFLGYFTNLGSSIGSALSNVGGIVQNAFGDAAKFLLHAGSDIIGGLVQGIKDAVGGLKSLLGDVTKLIPEWKGPPATDAKLLFGNGQLIMGGLMGGISSRTGALRSQLSDLTNMIPTSVPDVSSVGTQGAAGASGGYGMPDTVQLVDQDGTLLGRMRVLVDQGISANAQTRGLRLSAGSNRR